MISLLHNRFRTGDSQGFTFSRPLAVIQSDDWGRVGVCDSEGYEQLRANGVSLGERPYDLYTLETADDVNAVAALLARHKDSTGRAPCLVMNFCTANLNFPRMHAEGYEALKLLPLSEGLPGRWSRPGLFETYRAGIAQGVFYPALHGMVHCCPVALEAVLAERGERVDLLRRFWAAETPYIYWRMPWVGYEYWNPTKTGHGFLSVDKQKVLIGQAAKYFTKFLGTSPHSACAPGFRANRNTHFTWSQLGIRVAESGTGSGLRAPHMDEFGVLHLHRTIDFEPSQREVAIDKHLEVAHTCFGRGLPLIISVHSINFHSTLKDFRSSTISALDTFLTALEFRYPELLYVHDADIYEIVTTGTFRSDSKKIQVTVRREQWNPRPVQEAV